LVGENGSGKSTLAKILAGVVRPDKGRVLLGGREVKAFSPRRAIEAGVATCFQEVLVEDNLTVLENVLLWDRGWLGTSVSSDKRRHIARSVLAELSASPPPLDELVERLSLAARQLVAIARALAQRDAFVLLLDEPTAALDQSDSRRVLQTLRRRAAEGAIVAFTSHRLEEVEEIGDRTLVLRNGQLVGTMDRSEFRQPRLFELMSGAGQALVHDLAIGSSSYHSHPVAPRKEGSRTQQLPSGTDTALANGSRLPALRVCAAKMSSTAPAVDIGFGWGEITGLAGLDGHGQEALLKFMAGLMPPHAGRIEVMTANGAYAPVRTARRAVKQGIVYVPRDRKTEGILPTLTVLDNLALPAIAARGVLGVAGTRKALRVYQSLSRRLSIKAASWRAPITSLSGGNQQKVLIARWLALDPRIILLDDPTRGVDVSTKSDLYRLLRDLAAEGKAVILVSTDLEELASLCGRVIVMHRMRVSADLRRDNRSYVLRQQIIAAMFR
jgi:ABC-type sugar transport system ATPase subunit